MQKILSIPFLIFFFIHSWGQKKETVFLKWKLAPKEVLTYKTVMEETADSLEKFSVDFGNIFNSGDSSKKTGREEVNKFLKGLSNLQNENDLVTKLSRNKNGSIEIEMNLRAKDEAQSKADTSEVSTLLKLSRAMSGDVMLRGQISEAGEIKSFYLKEAQKNLIAILFQLPGRPIGIGDKWELDIQLITFDQNFRCDSSYKKNVVELIDLKKEKGETIAVIKYDIAEFASGDFETAFTGKKPTTMKMTHVAIGEFSIEQGRWISYKGLMMLNAKGVMNPNTRKKFELVPE